MALNCVTNVKGGRGGPSRRPGPSIAIIIRKPLITFCRTLALLLFCLCCGCAPTTHPEAPAALVVAFPAEPVTLNPLFLADHVSFVVSGFMFNGLTRFRPDLTITGDLAASWQIAADGKKITFYLRRGVKWHDGWEFTARDVVFTYKLLTSPAVPAPLSSQLGPVHAVRALDDYTVTVDYREPFGSALESWSLGMVPSHIFQDRAVSDPSFGRQPVGTGPYRVKAWIPGQRLLLEAFPEYFAGPPRIPTLNLIFLADAASRFMNLKAGRIDVMELSPAQDAVIRRHPEEWSQFSRYRCPGVRYGFLGFNLQDPRWQEPRVRLALSQAIDRTAILKVVLHGLGRPTLSPYPPDTYYFKPDLPRQTTLQQIGFLPLPPEQPLTLITNYESRENLAIAEIIQQNFAAVGIPLRIQTYDWLTFRHVVIDNRQVDLVLLSRSFLWDPDLYPLWHSSQHQKGAWNFLAYTNQEVDRLLEAGRRTLEPARRRQLYHRLQEIMVDDPPCLFLYAADTVFAARKRLRGLQPGPLEIFHNIADWSWGD